MSDNSKRESPAAAQPTDTVIPPLPPPPRRWNWFVLCNTWYKIFAIILLIFLILPPSRPPPASCEPYCWLDRDVPIFAIMGKTGIGKSTFIGQLGGRHVETGQLPIIGH